LTCWSGLCLALSKTLWDLARSVFDPNMGFYCVLQSS
jgi:hypothetical protein